LTLIASLLHFFAPPKV